jgi:hypothetical protein
VHIRMGKIMLRSFIISCGVLCEVRYRELNICVFICALRMHYCECSK